MAENTPVDVEMADGEDEKIIELKENAKSKKGRGFESDHKRNKAIKFEALSDDEDVSGPGPQRSVEGWIIFVRNMHEEATEEEVRDKFAEYGEIKNLHMNFDRRTGYIKGYVLIEYETFAEAQQAQKQMSNAEVYGKKIMVDWAFVKGPNPKSLSKKKSRARSRSRSLEHRRH